MNFGIAKELTSRFLKSHSQKICRTGKVIVTMFVLLPSFSSPASGSMLTTGLNAGNLCSAAIGFAVGVSTVVTPGNNYQGCDKVGAAMASCGVGAFCAAAAAASGAVVAVPPIILACLGNALREAAIGNISKCTAFIMNPTCCDMNSTPPGTPILMPSSGPVVNCEPSPLLPELPLRDIIEERCNRAVTGHCIGHIRCKSNCNQLTGNFRKMVCAKECEDWVSTCISRCPTSSTTGGPL